VLSPDDGDAVGALYRHFLANVPEGSQGGDSKEQEATNALEQPVKDGAHHGQAAGSSSGKVTVMGPDGLPRLVQSPGFNVRKPARPFASRGQTATPGVAEESMRVLSELARNGTALLDVLTDLAQLSSSSLTQAVGTLHQEVVRLEDVRTRLADSILAPFTSAAASSSSSPSSSSSSSSLPNSLAALLGLTPNSNGELRSLQNTTRTIFTIVEAIASNTGWIPYIFHNMQHVERLANRTLELAKRSLLTARWELEDDGGTGTTLTQAEALSLVYDTNVKLQRIMPALTRLLAEPGQSSYIKLYCASC
jgi:hypothetical protein